jgi:hypothetical protein
MLDESSYYRPGNVLLPEIRHTLLGHFLSFVGNACSYVLENYMSNKSMAVHTCSSVVYGLSRHKNDIHYVYVLDVVFSDIHHSFYSIRAVVSGAYHHDQTAGFVVVPDYVAFVSSLSHGNRSCF